MITEDYVSVEIAKLLKEKGFDEPTVFRYGDYPDNNDLLFAPSGMAIVKNSETQPYFYSAPTLQTAMKWLREVHNLHCSIDYDYVLGWYCQITSLKETVECDYEEMKHYHPEKDNGFSSSEEACEAAIKYCLENLI